MSTCYFTGFIASTYYITSGNCTFGLQRCW